MKRKVKTKYFWETNIYVVLSFAIMLVVTLLFISNQNDFLSGYGLRSIFNQIITLCIVTFAQTVVIISGGIDLSLGYIVGLTNALAATIMQPLTVAFGVPIGILLVVVISLLCGLLCGLINGLLIAFGRLQPIVVTLATSTIFMGIGMYIRPSPGGIVLSEYSRSLTGSLFGIIPVSAIILFAVIFLVWIPFKKTKTAQAIYAIGNNESAAYLSSINIIKTKVKTYLIAGVTCGVAALLLTAQTASGDPIGSSTFTINSIAAVVLGGTDISGGNGGYIGSVSGAVTISLILGLLIFWNISSFYQGAVQGGILILVLGIRMIRQYKQKTI